MRPILLRQATHDDIDAITTLVNQAYRPQQQAGWTHEAALIDGPRINNTQLADTLQQPDSYVLLAWQDSRLLGCVNVAKDGAYAYIGMLAVDPAQQTAGLGKRLLAAAEEFANTELGIAQYRIIVLSSRSELIAFYLRRGYRRTGQIMDYPLGAGVGKAKQPGLTIEVLEKTPDGQAEPQTSLHHP